MAQDTVQMSKVRQAVYTVLEVAGDKVDEVNLYKVINGNLIIENPRTTVEMKDTESSHQHRVNIKVLHSQLSGDSLRPLLAQAHASKAQLVLSQCLARQSVHMVRPTWNLACLGYSSVTVVWQSVNCFLTSSQGTG